MNANQAHHNFTSEVIQFVSASARQRLMLIAQGKSKSTNPKLYDIANGLLFDIKQVVSDLQAAKFIQDRSADINELIPKMQCKTVQSRIMKFHKLQETSKSLLSC